MARRNFKVSKAGFDKVDVSADLPENLSDPLWSEVVSNPDEDINDLALQQLIVKMQAGARAHLEGGVEAVQRFVDGYKYGARGGGFVPSISAEGAAAQGFTEEQLAFLRQAGMAVPGSEDEAENTEYAESETEGVEA